MNPPTGPTTSIEDLPPEMIFELFEYLHPKDLAACSMVNRRWHSIYAGFKLDRLVATDCDPFYDLSKWYDSNETIQSKERCSSEIFCRLAEKPLLSNLKQLILCSLPPEFDSDKLKALGQLVHLEINIQCFSEMNLNLPKLKFLALHRFAGCCSIDCPQLSTLVYYSEAKRIYDDPNLLNVKHPKTLRKLETNWFGPKLAPFKNVECLLTREFDAISKATLLSLPRLKELCYSADIESLSKSESPNEVRVDRMKRTLSEFVDDAKKLRGFDFRFSFCGFQLTKMNVDQIDFAVQVDGPRQGTMCNECVYLKNYQLIEPGALPFVHRINYTRLLSNVTGEFPRCFSQKFTGISEVHATADVQDANQFLWFLKSLRSLETLLLLDQQLAQAFYDQLPASAHSLAKLFLKARESKNVLQLNFDFIGNFSCLSFLSIEAPLSFESLTSLVRSLGRVEFAQFNVRSKGECICIRNRWNSTVWMIFKLAGGRLLFETENPGEIANFIERLQADRPDQRPETGPAFC